MQKGTAEARPTEENDEDAAVPDERKTKTVEQASRILGIGRSAAYAAAKRGELPTIKMGRRVLVPVAALERLLQETA